MPTKLLKFIWIPIYLFYAYIFSWQIYYYNKEDISVNTGRWNFALVLYAPSIILLCYAIVLYANLVLKQRRFLTLNSVITSSILYLYNTSGAIIIATLLLSFALVNAALELRNGLVPR